MATGVAFIRGVTTIAADQTTYTYQLPNDITSGKVYRFFLLQTENLPYERELKYIESTSTSYGGNVGTQYINTGIIGKLGITMEANFVWLDGYDSVLLGARKGSTRFYGDYLIRRSGDGGKKYMDWTWGYGDKYPTMRTLTFDYDTSLKPAFHVVCEMKTNVRSLVVNDKQVYSMTESLDADTWNTGLPMYVFGCNWDNAAKLCIKARLSDMKIWQDNVLVRDYRPVYVNGDGALYDGVSGTIFPNGSSTKFNLGEATDEANRRGFVRAMSQDFVALSEEEFRTPVTSYWEGGVDGDLAKDENWRSVNGVGLEVAMAPVSTTLVHFSGSVNASWASASETLGAAKIICENVHLATNCDWRVFGSVPFEGNLNLNGWKLQLAGLTGTGAITDRPLVVTGYQALDYIEASDYAAYIDSGVIGATGATVEIDVMGVQRDGYDVCVVGSRKSDMRFLPFWRNGSTLALGYNAYKGGAGLTLCR